MKFNASAHTAVLFTYANPGLAHGKEMRTRKKIDCLHPFSRTEAEIYINHSIDV